LVTTRPRRLTLSRVQQAETPQIQVAHPVLEKRLDVRFGFKSETESELSFAGERAQYGWIQSPADAVVF